MVAQSTSVSYRHTAKFKIKIEPLTVDDMECSRTKYHVLFLLLNAFSIFFQSSKWNKAILSRKTLLTDIPISFGLWYLLVLFTKKGIQSWFSYRNKEMLGQRSTGRTICLLKSPGDGKIAFLLLLWSLIEVICIFLLLFSFSIFPFSQFVYLYI